MRATPPATDARQSGAASNRRPRRRPPAASSAANLCLLLGLRLSRPHAATAFPPPARTPDRAGPTRIGSASDGTGTEGGVGAGAGAGAAAEGAARLLSSRVRGLFRPIGRRGGRPALPEEEEEEADEDADVLAPVRRAIAGARRRGGRTAPPPPEPVATVHVYLNRILPAKKRGGGDDLERVALFLRDLDTVLRKDATFSEVVDEFAGTYRVDFNGTRMRDVQLNLFPLKIYKLMVVLRERDGFELVSAFGNLELNLERRRLQFDFQELSILGFSAALLPSRNGVLGAASPTRKDKKPRSYEKEERPFYDGIGTNQTSKPMEKVLELFDEWYFRILKN